MIRLEGRRSLEGEQVDRGGGGWRKEKKTVEYSEVNESI